VGSRNLVNEEAMAHWWWVGGGGVAPKTNNIVVKVIHNLGLSPEKYWHIYNK